MLTGPLPQLVDYQKLANQARVLEGSIPVKQFNRLADLLVSDDGDVHLKLEFALGSLDRTEVQGQVSAAVQLVCQHCMTSYRQTIVSDITLVIVTDENDALELDEDIETYVAGDRHLSIIDLVEDELLLAVPMIPRHSGDECPVNDFIDVSAEVDDSAADEDGTTHRPFADLATVLAKNNETEN